MPNSSSACDVMSGSTCDSAVQEKRQKCSIVDVHQQGVSLVASLRSNSAVPCNVVSEVVQSFNHITHTAVDYLKHEILHPLQAVSGLSPTLLSHIEQTLNDVDRPFDFFVNKI